MALELNTLERLQAASDARDRPKYYERLTAAGDPYGPLALGVVKQSTMSGRVARCYAIAVSRRCCRPIDEAMWLQISEELMRSDLAARRAAQNFEPAAPSLRWNIIRDYHVATFRDVAGLPPETWTAWIPLELQGEDKDQKLWRRMLTEDFLSVAVQTVWMVAFGVAHRAGAETEIGHHVIPTLTYHPPLVASSDPRIDACMRKFEAYEARSSGLSDRERMATFCLSVLAQDPDEYWQALTIAPTAAWRGRPSLISPAY